MYIKLTNGVPEIYSIGKLRRDNPSVSFPAKPPKELLAKWDVYSLKTTSEPECDELTQVVSEATPVQIDGVWTQQWAVENKPQVLAEKNIRKHRGYLLSETDWVVAMSYERGEEVPEVWVNYRQALRDVPDQGGFPYNVIWPTKPE